VGSSSYTSAPLFLLMRALPARSTPFPYTTLFRSCATQRFPQRVCCPSVRTPVRQPFLQKKAIVSGPTETTKKRYPWEYTKPIPRSEEHTSELQSREKIVCRLLLQIKKTDAREWSG